MKVHVTSDDVPAFMAFRDGFTDAMWTPVAAGKAVDITVHGAYSLTVVCNEPGGGFLMWQASHTTDDDIPGKDMPPVVATPCSPPADLHTVTGNLAKAGKVHLGDSLRTVDTDGGQFSFSMPDGDYYLTAADSGNTKAVVQAIKVDGADVTLAAAVDVAATGVALTAIKLEVDNAPPPPDPKKTTNESVIGTVAVNPKGGASSPIFSGLLDLGTPDAPTKTKAMGAFSIPDAALTAAGGGSQTAMALGIRNRHDINTDGSPRDVAVTIARSLTKPFKMGDDVTKGILGNGLSLPTAISIPASNFDKSRLAVALPTLPALDDLTMTATGTSTATTGAKAVTYQLNITDAYFGATLLAHPVFDTAITGFKPEWLIDFSQEYTVGIVSQHDVVSKNVVIGHETSSFFEDVTTDPPPDSLR